MRSVLQRQECPFQENIDNRISREPPTCREISVVVAALVVAALRAQCHQIHPRTRRQTQTQVVALERLQTSESNPATRLPKLRNHHHRRKTLLLRKLRIRASRIQIHLKPWMKSQSFVVAGRTLSVQAVVVVGQTLSVPMAAVGQTQTLVQKQMSIQTLLLRSCYQMPTPAELLTNRKQPYQTRL